MSGGHWLYSTRETLEFIKYMGFNAISHANNHATDWGTDCLKDSLTLLRNMGILVAGAGNNLEEATRGSIMKYKDKSYGLVAMTTTFPKTAMSSNPTGKVLGRPGVSYIRHSFVVTLPEDEWVELRNIAMRSRLFIDINDQAFNFLGYRIQLGKTHSTTFVANKKDIERVVSSVNQLIKKCKNVVVSVHCHESEDLNRFLPPSFLKNLARTFIEDGAVGVVCHGAHNIRGIEIYNGYPIFYGLGNFAFDVKGEYPEFFYQGLAVRWSIEGNNAKNIQVQAVHINDRGVPTIPNKQQSDEIFSKLLDLSIGIRKISWIDSACIELN
ncbi:hypothetical protein BJQ97_03420 [Geobacillus sp. TFV-3]|nr:hypothetical protein BJQ97_00787 [Geobacillus sp. TFV-3]KAF0996730.1 hypothetical protein BJQ97_03420 [Geobacillus sp. TFV-3]